MSKQSKKRQAAAKPPQRATKAGPVTWWPLAVALLVVGAAVWLLMNHVRETTAPPQPAPSVFAGGHYSSQGHQGHMPGDGKKYANFRYSSDPPTSGFHREIFSPGFVNAQPLPKYVQVHLLEHGNILLQYNCLCPDVVQQLSEIANEFNTRLLPAGTITPTFEQVQQNEEGGLAVVVAPYPSMTHTIALTAWTRLATLPAVDKPKIVSFINRWLHDADNLNQ
jgi:hypothetical protein